MLNTPKEKVNTMQEHMANVRSEMEALRGNQKEMLESKNSVTSVKKAFDGLMQ
jgi:hypothetical protein